MQLNNYDPFPTTIPIICEDETFLYPFMIVPVFLTDEKDIEAINYALDKNSLIMICTTKDDHEGNRDFESCYEMGVVGSIMRKVALPDGRVKILFQGLSKGKILEPKSDDDFMLAEVDIIENSEYDETKVDAILEVLKDKIKTLASISSSFPPDMIKAIESNTEVHRIADLVASSIKLTKVGYYEIFAEEMALDNLFNHKLDRKSMLIALGGGVIGDMTGFIASLYQRGIDFIQIPTTLLAQVDSSVGGKTGVNNKFGKNLIGAFHQPKTVYIDPHFLSTLPKREFSAGVAEIIKMAVMFDREFFEWLESNTLDNEESIKHAIRRSVELKAQIVIADEKEKGERAKLNYGHTFCHVIENETNYSTYLHGEAVAIGIVMANMLAQKLGLFTAEESARVQNLLKKYDLPLEYSIDSIDSFYDKFFLDKKAMDSKLKFILPNSIGGSLIKDDISEDTLKDILREFGK
jgi:3-dehydroquinate synthase